MKKLELFKKILINWNITCHLQVDMVESNLQMKGGQV